MRASVVYFQDAIAGINAGRANSNLLNGIKVEYYGSQTPISHVAVVSAANPRLLVVQPFDTEYLVSIEKAIKQSALNLNPQRVRNLLHIPIAPISGDRQKALAKHINQLAEQQRIAVRNIRREVRHQLEDKILDNLTKTAIKEIDELAEAKISTLQAKSWTI